MVNIYVLELENNKYYIDKTEYNSIPQNINSQWVKQNKTVRIIDFYPTDNIFEENNLTKKYMLNYGIDNVRGGSYKNIELSEIEKTILNKELEGLNQSNNNNDYYNDLLTASAIKKEIKNLKKICEEYFKLEEKLKYVFTEYFKIKITPNVFNDCINFFVNNLDIKIIDNKLKGTKTNIKICDDIFDKVNYDINSIHTQLYKNSFLTKNNSKNCQKIKIYEIYIYNIKIDKQMQDLLISPNKLFSNIDEIYQTINLLLEKQIMLEEVNDEEDTFLDDEDNTILDNDDATTITNDDGGFINDSDDLDNITFIDSNDDQLTERSIGSLINKKTLYNKN